VKTSQRRSQQRRRNKNNCSLSSSMKKETRGRMVILFIFLIILSFFLYNFSISEDYIHLLLFLLLLGVFFALEIKRIKRLEFLYPSIFLLNMISPTPVEALDNARKIAMEEGLDYVYMGNVPCIEGQNTICPKCGKITIKREGYNVNFSDGHCSCGQKIAGVWK
jgi:hypothetical protein